MLLVSPQEPDPLACLGDVRRHLQAVIGSRSTGKLLPSMIDTIKSILAPQLLDSLMPAADQVTQRGNLLNRWSMASYTQKKYTPTDASVCIIDISRKIYGVLHGGTRSISFTGSRRPGNKKQFGDSEGDEGHEPILYQYREALDNMLPYISETLLVVGAANECFHHVILTSTRDTMSSKVLYRTYSTMQDICLIPKTIITWWDPLAPTVVSCTMLCCDCVGGDKPRRSFYQ